MRSNCARLKATPVAGLALDGALCGGLIWFGECALIALIATDLGGLSLLRDLAPALARWGLIYGAIGAVIGLSARWGRGIPLLIWLGLAALGPTAVLPAWVYFGPVLLGWGLALGLHRLSLRGRAVLGAGLGAALVLVAIPPRPPPRAGRVQDAPHVLLIVADSLRADRLSPTLTPEIWSIAQQGQRFTAVRSTASWTLPAHASLFTGVLPSEHGAHATHPRLDGELPTLAERFAARGYRTVGLSANAWVSAGTGLDRGFDRFDFLGDRGIAEQLLLARWGGREADLGGAAITRQAQLELERASRDGVPLFLFINYLEAHEPLGSIPGEDPSLGRLWMRDMPRFWCACERDAGGLVCDRGLYRADPARVAEVIRRYDAGATYIDAQIGALRQTLVQAGQWDQSWLVFTSDHGEQLGEDGRLGHMVWLQPSLVDIPLVVHGPGLPVGIDSDTRSLMDLPGWLLASTAGTPPPPPAPGAIAESHPHARSKLDAWGAAFGCDFAPAAVPRRSAQLDGVRVLREANQIWAEANGARREPTPAERARVSGPFDSGSAKVDAQTRQQLRAIGYVE